MFDVATAYAFVGLLYLLLPVVGWIVLSSQQSVAANLWTVGSLMFGAALLLLAMRDMVPDWISYTGAFTLGVAGNLLRVHSLHLELRRPLPVPLLVGLGVAAVLIYEFFRVILQDDQLRFAMSLLSLSALMGAISVAAWEIARLERSRSARWVAVIYGFLALVLAGRVVRAMLGLTLPDAGAEDIDSVLTALSALLSAVFGAIGYVGLYLERSSRVVAANAAERAREYESARLGRQVAHLDRRRLVGELSSSIAHEVNQPLGAMVLNAEVALQALRRRLPQEEELRTLLSHIRDDGLRAADIVSRVREWVRATPPRSEPVDLTQLAGEVWRLVHREGRELGVEFRLRDPSSTGQAAPVVMGDPVVLSQVLLNAYRNALQAMRPARQRRLEVDVRHDGAQVRLTIRDTGEGLAEAALRSAGEFFFTTKPDGMGVGLAISRAIAQQHGGTLKIGNAPDGPGAVVELRLPAASTASVTGATGAAGASAAG